MWFSFWRSRNRFSLEELRYLTDQLQKVQIVNEVNKDFVVEALRSIAELMTYGDQHDSAFFEFFMEKQVMGEFVRILKISRSFTVSLQLLQTMSIMIQNIKNEHAIYYLFSNEHINYLITYSFDFRNEELLSYYVSFLRAISGKLNKSTISLLVKTQNEEVVSFPLYVEAVRFAFHEESMIRIAIRALTLNIYHVRDEGVNRYVASGSLADYFSDLVIFFKKQCINLNELVFQASKEASEELSSRITAAVDEIEDNLYYFSDVISAGIPNVERLVMDNLLRVLILPLLLSSLIIGAETQIGAITSLFLLCCILRLVKLKDLANTVAAALFYPREAFLPDSEAKLNGDVACSPIVYALSGDSSNSHDEANTMKVAIPEAPIMQDGCSGEYFCLREILLSYLTKGDDVQVLGSLSVLATLLQTKELDESMLDALGILPQRKQHKKLLLEALVGESSGEEQLFSSENNSRRDSSAGELDSYLQKLKEQYGVSYSSSYLRSSPHLYRFKVLDALVNLICRTDVSAEAMWDGGWLLRQLLPYSEAEFNRQHLERLRESYKRCSTNLHHEVRGIWADLLITVLCDEWRKCKRAIESPSPRKEFKYLLLPSQNQKSYHGDTIPSESSVLTGERVCELVKVFVLLYQFQIFCQGRALPDQPPLLPPTDVRENSRAKAVGLENVCPKPGTEIKLVDAVPCRIAFERGKERHLWFLAVSKATSGWLLLVEELPLRQNAGVVRVVAPLVASNPRIDDKHPRWLHVRIRPTLLPSADPPRRTKALVDGRWTLAFREEASCRSALSMVLDEINQQTLEIERRLKPLFDFSHVEVSSSLKPSIFS